MTPRDPALRGFPCAAELRERAAVEAARTIAPWTPLLVAVAIGFLMSSAILFAHALADIDRAIQLAERV